MGLAGRILAHPPTRADLGVLGVLAALTVFMAILVTRLPLLLGDSYVDDGVYLATAKALAEGHGYRHLELPAEPYQTKYPVLYPLLLALLWRLFPGFPDQALAYQLVNPVLWGIGAWLAYRLMRRVWAVPWWLAAAGTVLAFANPLVMGVLRTTMSEPLYFLLSMISLNFLIVSPPGPLTHGPAHAGLWRTILSAVLASAAYLTRSIGLTLIVALLAGLLSARRWKHAVAVAAVAGLAIGGWQAWCRSAMAANAAQPTFPALHYDLDYGAQIRSSLRTVAWVGYQNTSDTALALLEVAWQPPKFWLDGAPGGGLAGGLPLYAGVIAASLALLIGLAATWNRAQPTVHLYLLAYFFLVLAWPFRTPRFLIPILPLVTTLQFAGLYSAVVFCAGLVQRAGRRPSPPRPAPNRWFGERAGATAGFRLVMAGALMLGLLRYGPLVKLAPHARDYVGTAEKEQLERAALVAILLAETPPDAVISAPYGAYLYLRTGRKYVPPLPNDDPISVAYAPDRKFSECGRVVSPGMLVADLRFTNQRFVDYLRIAGVSYVVPLEKHDNSYWAVFSELRDSAPQRVRRVASAPPYELYRISLPPADALRK